MAKSIESQTYTYINEDGIEIKVYPYIGPRKGEKTYDVNKSKYTPWTQGVSNYERGTRGVNGTVEKVN